jgi:DNA ligase-associated metallophosphoesterase
MNQVENLWKRSEGYAFEFDRLVLSLLHEKALWINGLSTLLIADLHFGKAAHFRKSGIPIPEPVHDFDLFRLHKLHEELRPSHTYFLGDLFHSDWNGQWNHLNDFLGQFSETQFHLVKGNHDVLSAEAYSQSVMLIHQEPVKIESLLLSHEPLKSVSPGHLNVCGHIHPGIHLYGRARQSVTLPCFYLSRSCLLLPAFGNFTGLARVRPKGDDKVWAIANEKILQLVSGTPIG